jgi:ketosteroid isomerase-like protein
MRWTLLAMLSALSVCATSSTLGGKNPADETSKSMSRPVVIDAEIQAMYSRFSSAFAARDINSLMSVFDRTVILSYQDSPDMNYAELKAGFENDFRVDPPGTRWEGVAEECRVEGNMAVVIGHWENQVTKKDSVEVRQRIRSVDILRRKDGKWKIVRTINYPEQ